MKSHVEKAPLNRRLPAVVVNGYMVRILKAVLLAAAVAGIASQQVACFILAGMAIGTGIHEAVARQKEPEDEWLLPDGGKPVRTPTKKPDPPSDRRPVVPDDDTPPPKPPPPDHDRPLGDNPGP